MPEPLPFACSRSELLKWLVFGASFGLLFLAPQKSDSPAGANTRRGAAKGKPGPPKRTPASGAASDYFPALKAVNTRVCTRRIGCGTLSGAVMIFLSASLRKMVVFSATSFLTNFSEAAFGFA